MHPETGPNSHAICCNCVEAGYFTVCTHCSDHDATTCKWCDPCEECEGGPFCETCADPYRGHGCARDCKRQHISSDEEDEDSSGSSSSSSADSDNEEGAHHGKCYEVSSFKYFLKGDSKLKTSVDFEDRSDETPEEGEGQEETECGTMYHVVSYDSDFSTEYNPDHPPDVVVKAIQSGLKIVNKKNPRPWRASSPGAFESRACDSERLYVFDERPKGYVNREALDKHKRTGIAVNVERPRKRKRVSKTASKIAIE